jgi:hypothetical protein
MVRTPTNERVREAAGKNCRVIPFMVIKCAFRHLLSLLFRDIYARISAHYLIGISIIS